MMEKKRRKKKRTPSDWIMDGILVAVALIVLILLGSMLKGKLDVEETGKKAVSEKEDQKKETSRYTCVISDGSSNDTVFTLEFNNEKMTYQESLTAAGQSTDLDKGTFKQDGNTIVANSEKSRKQISYIIDKDYLLAKDALYQGTIPKGNTFEAECTYMAEGECQTTVTFHENGRYEQKVISAGKDGSLDPASKVETGGTYERTDNIIHRTSDAGELLLDFYIYQNQLSNAYYILEK